MQAPWRAAQSASADARAAPRRLGTPAHRPAPIRAATRPPLRLPRLPRRAGWAAEATSGARGAPQRRPSKRAPAPCPPRAPRVSGPPRVTLSLARVALARAPLLRGLPGGVARVAAASGALLSHLEDVWLCEGEVGRAVLAVLGAREPHVRHGGLVDAADELDGRRRRRGHALRARRGRPAARVGVFAWARGGCSAARSAPSAGGAGRGLR